MYSQIDANKRKTFFLMAIFIVFVLFIAYFISLYYETGFVLLIFAGIFATTMSLVSYYSGDKIALVSTGARAIEKSDNPYVYRLVENLCITAGVAMPAIYIINDPAPNAFATGRDPEHASIALTTGIIEKLENEELEGVIAHELSHIKNYDIRLMMIVIVLVGFLAIISDIFLRMSFFGRKRDDKGNLGIILLIIGLVSVVLSPIIAKLIQLAISRKREYLADASGALLTRFPDGLANALEKISQYSEPMQKAGHSTAHLFISSPFGPQKKFSNLFSTHPPIADRIKKLREITI
ncbi:zinc metalloprotease HtpX [Candidatus Falkowbacteria bacterium RIFOXYD2_FULL_35_9]|uniref:Protease HtpX homolog n=1 Tax=Candidatus Falkowbacteria bacterium RIFOXYC2_FULL_36_12 TaxID=1798002 RepID=A0A1F5T175_9BACT|nr:MAG: zinc metalloprotease HtpX [Candidatus Falkowbacteria bacterium RIFOXYB2_FULL_35_7]OGF32486.1 MAG: zinc metalloprotease HtpX [Candidatus Falkowbacteria bacterium RIFOXYC2_FULL_36_12]OGF46254.1 MAG: zinc metalloprotease HtpX [Candidatus Falkowbacteria bacterium RIFOXYD2_FULL_35_9]